MIVVVVTLIVMIAAIFSSARHLQSTYNYHKKETY